MNRDLGILTLAALFALGATATRAGAQEDLAKSMRARYGAIFQPLPDAMPGSENDTAERIHLGEELYFETALSANNTQSCNSCHRVDEGLGGVDNEPTSPGAFGARGDRNAPTTLNAGFHLAQFWDGRAADLQAQAKGPILNPVEMAMESEEAVLEKLGSMEGYPELFEKAFPDAEPAMTYDNLAEAIAAFERTLVTHDRFDDFLGGDDEALSEEELKGMEKFVTTGCITCHQGPALGGMMYQKMGQINAYANFIDKGRSAVTGNPAEDFFFKVPSLRNIALTAPYFHDGGAATLEAAVQNMAWLQLGRKLAKEDVDQLVAFMHALTDKERAE